ncbi:alkylphosphonate utilization protein [Marinovum sp.]|uniref:alkylphosphonate utilization protein n=1 Tax=Marinovum sp. TaxID=2024839 RepID=UPI002B2671CF|nr:alkylphosphonate utilization protein [Marinovum sp.]
MSLLSMPLRITGARVLGDSGLAAGALTVSEGRISDGPAPELALPGFDILPGIVDIHARPAGATSLAALDRQLAAQGITTAWVAQGWGWQGGAWAPEAAADFLARHARHRLMAGTDLRVLLHCDTHMMDSEARLLDLLERHAVRAVLFVDSLGDNALQIAPGQRATAGALRLRGGEVHRFLCNLAHAFDVMNIRSGSYGDRDGQSRERLAMMGAKICVAPAASGAAAVARAWSDPVVLPAAGVTAAAPCPALPDPRDLIPAGMCDALVSDGAPEMLLPAALQLVRNGTLPLAGAWSLISSRPAQVLGLGDRGRLSPGQRADLVLLHRASSTIAATMSAGRWIYRNPDFALSLHPTGPAPATVPAAPAAPGRGAV